MPWLQASCGYLDAILRPGEVGIQCLSAHSYVPFSPERYAPFLVLSGGRTRFRVEDLVALVRLLDELDGGCQ